MEGLKQEISDLIKVRVASESRGVHGRLKPLVPGITQPHATPAPVGPRISGAELAKIGPVIDLIDDEVLKNQVRSYFSMTTKFQALGIITNERSEIYQKYPAIAIRIAEIATETERAIVAAARKSFDGR